MKHVETTYTCDGCGAGIPANTFSAGPVAARGPHAELEVHVRRIDSATFSPADLCARCRDRIASCLTELFADDGARS
jgi:hypothetical protein